MKVAWNLCEVEGGNSNLTPEERDGTKRLQDRIRKKEVVVATTDKSGKLVVC